MSRRGKTGSLLLLAVGVAGAAVIHRATHGRWFPRSGASGSGSSGWPAHAGTSSPAWAPWNPIPIYPRIKGVRGERPDDVWAWSPTGMMHWDGRAWTRVRRPPRGGVEFVSESTGALWVRTAVYQHHPGGGCTPRYTSRQPHDWCRTRDNKWEEGECGPRSLGSRPPVPPPTPELEYADPAELAHLWEARADRASLPAIELTHAFRVGGELWAIDKTERWLAHFDGHTWTAAANPMRGFAAIWLANANDGWAVGDQTLLRWNGRDWKVVREAPDMLTSIWGSSANDVWAVGVRGLLMHFDGDRWTEQRLAGGAWLAKVVGRARDDVWIAGCDPTGLVAHWDGKAWTVRRIDPAGGLVDPAHGSCPRLAPEPGGRALAAVGVLMFSFADGSWRDVTGPLAGTDGAPVAAGEIAALAAGGDRNMWAVGSQPSGWAAPARGPLVLRRLAGMWKQIDVGSVPGDAKAVWARASDDVWVVGTGGMILHFDGRSWTREESGTDETLVGIHGAGDAIWVIGEEGGLLRRRL